MPQPSSIPNGTPTALAANTNTGKDEKPKSEKRLKYEAKISKQQQQKQANGVVPSTGKAKEQKKQKIQGQPSAPYVEETPRGQKKSEHESHLR